MRRSTTQAQHTQHALLVAWGAFAAQLGLLEQLQAVPLKQKRYYHTPQGKVLELLVASLAGLPHLQDLSLAAHPLDKDQAVAEAWGQSAWADYSGVSRTLRGLSWAEVHQIAQVLTQLSQPYLAAEVAQLGACGQRLQLDGDLTGLPVSNTSRTYPNAAFGHMDDDIRLGYQAAVVSLQSPTYGRLWLAVAHHPGDTVACTQAEALALAAEARLGQRPWRRTELLQRRVQASAARLAAASQRVAAQEQRLQQAHTRLDAAILQQQVRQQALAELECQYQAQQRPERPTSGLAQARQRLQATEKRRYSRAQAAQAAQQRLDKTRAGWQVQQAEWARLSARYARFEAENAANPEPVTAEFRLDAGFGSYENLALLIEMGYEVYTKPYSHRVAAYLRRQVTPDQAWVRVGANAELVAWRDLQLKGCPYPLDVALERFQTGQTVKHSVLLHFGGDVVTADLPGWFRHYNARQTIEAGIKESKQVFYLHRLKVRTEPAIYLQECFVVFAANFIRWATHWLASQTPAPANTLDVHQLGVKRQVQVGAHASAQVIRNSAGKLLRFSEHSAFAGYVLQLPSERVPPPGRARFRRLRAVFMKSLLIAQPLR